MELEKMSLLECLIDEEIVAASSIYVFINGTLAFEGTHKVLYKALSYQLMMKLNVVKVMWNDREVYIDVEGFNND